MKAKDAVCASFAFSPRSREYIFVKTLNHQTSCFYRVHDRTTGKICGVVKCIFPHNIFNGISEEMKRSERRGIQLGLWAARHNISRVTKYMSVLEDTEQFKYIVRILQRFTSKTALSC